VWTVDGLYYLKLPKFKDRKLWELKYIHYYTIRRTVIWYKILCIQNVNFSVKMYSITVLHIVLNVLCRYIKLNRFYILVLVGALIVIS